MVAALVKRVRIDAQPFLHSEGRRGPLRIVLVVALKLELVNHMPKVVDGPVLQVRHEVLDMVPVALEALPEAEPQARLDLLDPHPAGHTAPVLRLRLDLLCPALLLALLDRVRVGEGPTTVEVRLSDGLACLAAPALGLEPAVARAAVAGLADRGDARELVRQVADGFLLRVWPSFVVEADFHNVVRKLTHVFPRKVGGVEAEHYRFEPKTENRAFRS